MHKFVIAAFAIFGTCMYANTCRSSCLAQDQRHCGKPPSALRLVKVHSEVLMTPQSLLVTFAVRVFLSMSGHQLKGNLTFVRLRLNKRLSRRKIHCTCRCRCFTSTCTCTKHSSRDRNACRIADRGFPGRTSWIYRTRIFRGVACHKKEFQFW